MTWPVTITGHALERAGERAPGLTRAEIVADVREALAAGRVSHVPPPGVSNYRGRLFAWTLDRTRVYVLAPDDDAFGVVTIIGDAVAAA
jgi:hypothetical protein